MVGKRCYQKVKDSIKNKTMERSSGLFSISKNGGSECH